MNAGRTATPVQFQVNGEDLAELEGGEIAITNLFSGNGEEFVLQLHIPGLKGKREAHARLKCVYFPVVEGKESIDMILERLQKDGLGVSETFDNFSRTSVRRLGRLLPDARWGRLPFMEPKQRKGSKAQILKRCSMRVKCFIDTDAGVNPNNFKTDLATKDPCTIFLKTLGSKAAEKETEANFVILRGGNHLTLSQLEKEYEEWIFQMHTYDHEIESNDIEDSAVVVVLTEQKQKEFGVRSSVVRVHDAIKRKGQTWKAKQKLKILKGAGAGCHKQNMYATLEYILLEGLDGDSCGEVRLVCRPLDVPEEDGCSLTYVDGEPRLDIKSSKTFPISIIDDEKCKPMDNAELAKQLHWLQMKAPLGIDLLNAQECRKLGLDYALTFESPVYAEGVISKSIIAVLRPASYDSSSSSRSLDQKFIVKDDLEMSMEITYLGEDHSVQQEKHVYAERIKHSTRSGIQGLYIFKVGSKSMNSGIYKFLFTCSAKKLEKRLTVRPDPEVGRWKLLRDDKHSICSTRVGSHLPCLSVAYLDAHGDHVPFKSLPKVMVKLESTEKQIINVQEAKTDLSFDRMVLNISEICIESSMLDNIRPNYKINLVIYSKDEVYSVSLPWQVTPGPLYNVRLPCEEIENHLVPGSVIKKLVLEMLDKYNNHVEAGVKISIKASGLSFIDDKGTTREVDDNGFIDLSGVLKVNASYGNIASLSVYHGRERCYKKDFHVDRRTLRIASEVPDHCLVGSELKDITFEVVDSDDAVDGTIHHSKSGDSHTLKITSGFSGVDDSLEYSFYHGKCTVQSIRVPKEEGLYMVSAMHVYHSELSTSFQLRVTQPSTAFHEDVPLSTPKKRMPSTSWHEDVPYHTPKRKMLSTASHEDVLFHTPRRGTPSTPSYGDVPFQTPKTGMLLLKDANDLENAVTNAGEQVGQHEKKLKLLNDKKSMIYAEICQLQASLEPEELTPLDFYTNDKEGMTKHIEGKVNSAASAISKMMKYSLPSEHRTSFQEDIIGIVSLLGTVDNFELSRILAEYVGEDNMLAIVCKSSETTSDLEKYNEQGTVEVDSVLYQIASEFRMSINGTFLVFCLEELSPFKGMIIKGDPQRKLDLPDPRLSTGNVPNGFLGYAVNFINLEANCVDTRTSKGHGLRETLFYSLLGELQVYENKDCMKQASSCLKNGAVSLDGGIIKGNSARSFGFCNPVIRFPVESMEAPSNLSQETMNILREVEQKKLDLEETSVEIERETQVHSEVMKVFLEKKERLNHYLTEKERLNHYLTEKEATVGSPQVHSQGASDSRDKEVKVERLDDD